MTPNLNGIGHDQWEYGKLRSSQVWIAWVMLTAGVLAVPVAWFVRNQLVVAGSPLPAWAVLLVGSVIAIVGLAVSITLLLARSRPAKLITIADGKIRLPGGLLSGRGWSLPIADVTIRTTDLGFVRQMQLSGPRTRTTLSSALFSDDDEFDRLVGALSKTDG
jgi:hypothetical protein